MNGHCSIGDCQSTLFKHGLCEQHYTTIVKEALDTEHGSTAKAAPGSLNVAIYLFNRVVDRLLDGYRRTFALERDDLLRIHMDEVQTHMRKGASKRAARTLEQAARLAPDNAEVTQRLGELYLREGQYREALLCFRQIEEHGGANDAEVTLKIGEALTGLGRHPEAVEYLRRAADTTPRWAEPHFRLGTALEASEQIPEAINAYKRAAEMEPRAARYLQALGFAHEAVGEHEEALRCFKRAMQAEA